MSQIHAVKCANSECAACLEQHGRSVTRRSFVASLLGAGTAMIAGVIGLPLVKFVLSPLQGTDRKGEWSELGEAAEFDRVSAPVLRTITLTQRDGWRETVTEQALYVSRTSAGQLQVLSPVCPHLGCSVAWQDAENKFVCPCHGGQFDAHGRHVAGPPPRGLDQLDARVTDGKLQVQFALFRSNVPDKQMLS
ncbi:MAG TPA: ubiquinol-cytochrome c reductase iron-sulfur subunit [Terracidiphilus sp.]